MRERELYGYLRALPKQTTASHTTLLASVLPDFLEILGYEGSTIFFDFLLSLPLRIKADALVAEHRTGLPWIIVEVKTFNAMRDDPRQEWQAVKHSYLQFLSKDEQWLLLFSPKVLGLASKSEEHVYDLTQLTVAQSSEIYSLLRRPLKSSDGSSKRPCDIGTEAPL
ncbi:hypothetical protein [Desulfomonile tiedjei]|uniref:Uncharacterized protein n=1 Tax=Desulfomonile tiedjei (strain ATCC 49306 / DSM 6799 / DCB-1) TaxID=706587 RepID=I4C215_DESTA|nr:hypothetical protein [Desulfomonile tiedjei]AFM23606.1 hypothetical protein Desti_0885 [Desulfomonile tiedjei DSM 6799]